MIYDNGSLRCSAAPDLSLGHSRGQVYELDASGSLRGPDGNVSRTNEVRPDGTSVYALVSDTFMSRSHRLFNLYLTPPEWATTNTLALSEFFKAVP